MSDGTFANRSAVPEPLTLDELRRAADSLPPPAPPFFIIRADSSRELIDGLADACRRVGGALNIYREDALRPGCAWGDPNQIPPSVYLCEDDIQLLETVAAFDAWMTREESPHAR